MYQLVPPADAGAAWTENILYRFPASPVAGTPTYLAFSGEDLIGTTTGAGGGEGIVYQLQPPATAGGPWSEETLANFGGDVPMGGVIFQGVFYGAAEAGGANGWGSIFQLTP